MTKNRFQKKRHQSPGEAYVWLSGMGLSIGMVMIFFLLGLIFVKGVQVFWPKPVALIRLSENSPQKLMNSTLLAGEIVKKQEKTDLSGNDEDEAAMEWQLFIGNKDIYGKSFIYIDEASVQEVRYPEDIMSIERLEYGQAMAVPEVLLQEGHEPVSVSDEAFLPLLRLLVEDANERWKEIKKIEKKNIGAINRRLRQLRLKQKPGQTEAEEARLQKDYDALAAQARILRKRQTEDVLLYRAAGGQEKRLPIGQIVDFYYPNQLSLHDKMIIFLHKVWGFLWNDPREANTEGGVFPALFGTCVMTILMSIAVMPFGVLAAIYLREYAKQGFFVRAVRIAVNNLAGVPSIVFGVFGLGFFVYMVGGTMDHLFFKSALPTPTFGTGGILWASLTLALLTVPVVIVSTEEALASVPRGMREGSLACGASKWQTIKNVVLPAAAPGILTGLILAMARGASEVAPLMLVGVVKLAPNLPIDGIFPFFHLERKFMHLGFHIYDLGFQSPDSEAAKPMVFATTLLLITLVVVLNLGAIYIRQKLRKKYATGAF